MRFSEKLLKTGMGAEKVRFNHAPIPAPAPPIFSQCRTALFFGELNYCPTTTTVTTTTTATDTNTNTNTNTTTTTPQHSHRTALRPLKITLVSSKGTEPPRFDECLACKRDWPCNCRHIEWNEALATLLPPASSYTRQKLRKRSVAQRDEHAYLNYRQLRSNLAILCEMHVNHARNTAQQVSPSLESH